MKKNVKTYSLVVLVTIMFLAIIDSINTSNSAADIQNENERLQHEVNDLQIELEVSSNEVITIRDEQNQLNEDLSTLQEEINSLLSPVVYQDFMDAVGTVESYKKETSFLKVNQYFTLSTLFPTADKEGNCPCYLSFATYGGIEWQPNAVLDLKEFSVQKERILLTYETAQPISHHYQFVLVESTGIKEESAPRWRIEEIKKISKEF
ncbi:coiled-coil domain-containing protein [Bacillus pinisoli]|uniref:coiled-coil domain-containing protein n=1 Tax=Bacillus pinisoli TaxID=2901866 RepID=UPI001FF65051|nr:hypothetical protein [Bacillus pinisoli]